MPTLITMHYRYKVRTFHVGDKKQLFSITITIMTITNYGCGQRSSVQRSTYTIMNSEIC